jgi:hypothetical protein
LRRGQGSLQLFLSWCGATLPVIPSTQEAEAGGSRFKPAQANSFTRPYLEKPFTESADGWLKVKALSSSSSTTKKKKRKKEKKWLWECKGNKWQK